MKTEPKEVICPICGEKMFARNWGIQRQVYRGFGNEIVCAGESENYVSYDCSCGCQLNYKGSKDCWKKCEGKCKCKSCINFQKHYPYEAEDEVKCFRCGVKIELGALRHKIKNHVICQDCKNRGLDD